MQDKGGNTHGAPRLWRPDARGDIPRAAGGRKAPQEWRSLLAPPRRRLTRSRHHLFPFPVSAHARPCPHRERHWPCVPFGGRGAFSVCHQNDPQSAVKEPKNTSARCSLVSATRSPAAWPLVQSEARVLLIRSPLCGQAHSAIWPGGLSALQGFRRALIPSIRSTATPRM